MNDPPPEQMFPVMLAHPEKSRARRVFERIQGRVPTQAIEDLTVILLIVVVILGFAISVVWFGNFFR